MLRAIASSLLSLIVTATFMWGGCVSCEQYFMFPGAKQPCCNKSGQCNRPGKSSPQTEKRDCNRLPLERGKNVPAVPMLAVCPVARVADMQLQAGAIMDPHALVVPFEPSPPDRQVLHATFLI